MATAISMEHPGVVRIEKRAMIDVLHEELAFAELFMGYLLLRDMRFQEDLADQLLTGDHRDEGRSSRTQFTG